ncbi:NifU family protein [Persicimonas caeni]|uniref:NifU family protein n=1 Tax=Persicimonas caeni TaxID=2292766 RepID=A0A4Y6Q248_PERCE|nr:NifU family protein [Persicimonas caeni]QDG54664.1 NifU family protein [Persicimonas caeni]QED35885.1 NifU family protein [Persicimonas caeni]
MKIEEIEYTPNPNAVKFVLDQQLTLGGMTRSFESLESAEGVPLAKKILEIEHVQSVFFADRWLTVTQDGGTDWHGLMREIAEPIRAAVLDDARPPTGFAKDDDDDGLSLEETGLDDPRVEMIREVINEQILPYLQGDGGGLEIKALLEDQLMIRYEGACGTCPASTTGTLMAIENLIQEQVDPEITVVSV